MPESVAVDGLPARWCYDTRRTETIAKLVDWANGALDRPVTAADTLKNVLLKVREPGAPDWELLAIGLPGDREVDDKRLGAALDPAEYAILDDADFARHPFLVKGYIGPKALLDNGFATWSIRGWWTDVVDHRRGRGRQACRRPGGQAGLHRGRDHRGRRGPRR